MGRWLNMVKRRHQSFIVPYFHITVKPKIIVQQLFLLIVKPDQSPAKIDSRMMMNQKKEKKKENFFNQKTFEIWKFGDFVCRSVRFRFIAQLRKIISDRGYLFNLFIKLSSRIFLLNAVALYWIKIISLDANLF